MRVISVNVGLPREVKWRGRLVRTSIGFYFAVVREGDVAAGDAIEILERR